MTEQTKIKLIEFLNNFSALRIVHGYKMSDDEYIFYTVGMRALTTELLLIEEVNTMNLKALKERMNEDERNNTNHSGESGESEEGQPESA